MPRYISPQVQYFNDLGIPLTGGKLYFYEPSTLILKDTYSDTALAIPNTNPVILATNGSPAVDIWLSGVYRVRLFDQNDNLIWDKDPVGGDAGDRAQWGNWLSGISYNEGDIVVGSNDLYYVSIVEPNLNNDPVTSAAQWTEVRLLRVYNTNETYQIGVVVQDSTGFLWRAKAITTGSTPVIGSAFWEPAISGYTALLNLNYVTVVNAPTALAKNRIYDLRHAGPHTVPAISGTVDGDIIYLLHNPDIEPTVNCVGADVIRIGASTTSAADYTGVLINSGVSIILKSNGARWELN